MKRLLLILCLAVATPLAFTGCGTPPAARTAEFRTLKAIALSSKAGMDSAVTLLKQGAITVPQFQKIAAFHDTKLTPALSLAISTAQSEFTAPSDDLVNLATQFAALVAALTVK